MKAHIQLCAETIHRLLVLDSSDPVSSFILLNEDNSMCMLNNSLSQAKHMVDSRQLNGQFELLIDSQVVASVKGETLCNCSPHSRYNHSSLG